MKSTVFTWLFLLLVSVGSTAFSSQSFRYAFLFVVLLMAIKFIAIAFEFMELKVAHPFWRYALLLFLVFFVGIIVFFRVDF